MRWNLRMKAAERGIWKSTEMRRLLAGSGLEISAGKMSSLWIGDPVTIRLDDLDVICSVLDCTPADLLICEPDKVAARRPAQAQAQAGSSAPIIPVLGRHRSVPLHDRHDAHVPGVRDPAPGDARDPVLLWLLARRPGHTAAVPQVRLE